MSLPISTPSDQGVDSRGLLALLDALETPGHGMHSVMIARHGHLIAQGWWAPYTRERVHLGYSLSKSFTATVLGNLVGQGLLDLDAPVLQGLVDLASVSPKWRRVRVRDCISMTAGHSADAWTEEFRSGLEDSATPGADPVLERILATDPDGEPGQVWAYNQVATYLVAQAIAAASGERLSAHVRRLLLDPFGGGAGKAQRTPQGHDLGFSGLQMTTPAILALAQTWLDGGRWQGAPVVPDSYAALAPQPSAPSLKADEVGDWAYGYGFSFWGASHGYRGDGAFGQYAIVLPEQDMAVAITSETEVMQDVLDELWQHLLPAVDGVTDADADGQLRQRLQSLAHRALTSQESRAAEARRDPASELPAAFGRVSVQPNREGHLLVIDHPDGALRAEVGDGVWLESAWPSSWGADLPIVSSGGWQDGRFVAHVRLIETPHTVIVDLHPEAGTATLNWRRVPLTGPDPLAAAGQPI